MRKAKYEKELEEMRGGMLESLVHEVDAAIERLPPVFLMAELEELRQRWNVNEHPSGFKYAKNKLSTLQELEIQQITEIGKVTIRMYVDALAPSMVDEEREALSFIAKRKFNRKARTAEVVNKMTSDIWSEFQAHIDQKRAEFLMEAMLAGKPLKDFRALKKAEMAKIETKLLRQEVKVAVQSQKADVVSVKAKKLFPTEVMMARAVRERTLEARLTMCSQLAQIVSKSEAEKLAKLSSEGLRLDAEPLFDAISFVDEFMSAESRERILASSSAATPPPSPPPSPPTSPTPSPPPSTTPSPPTSPPPSPPASPRRALLLLDIAALDACPFEAMPNPPPSPPPGPPGDTVCITPEQAQQGVAAAKAAEAQAKAGEKEAKGRLKKAAKADKAAAKDAVRASAGGTAAHAHTAGTAPHACSTGAAAHVQNAGARATLHRPLAKCWHRSTPRPPAAAHPHFHPPLCVSAHQRVASLHS